jgi:hypothetical protein
MEGDGTSAGLLLMAMAEVPSQNTDNMNNTSNNRNKIQTKPKKVRALVVNELTSPSWTAPGAAGEGSTIGTDALITFQFATDRCGRGGGCWLKRGLLRWLL